MASSNSAPISSSTATTAEKWRSLFLDYRLLVQRYWWVLAITVTFGIVFQLILFRSKPTSYSSVARLVVGGKLSLPQDISYNEETVNFFGTQIEMIRGQEVGRGALEYVRANHPGVTPVPVELNVAQIPRTSLFFLQATGAEPRYVSAYLDGVLQAYITVRKGMFADKTQRALSVITDELARHEEELRVSENALFEWQRRNNMVSLREEDNSAGSYLSLLNRRLATLETEYRLLQTLTVDQNLDRVATAIPTSADEAAASGLEVGSHFEPPSSATEYLKTRQQLTVLMAQLAMARENQKEKHPEIIAMEKQIALVKKALEVIREQGGEQLTARRDALKIQIDNTKAEIAEWQERTLSLSQRLGEADRLKAKVERQKELYNKLLSNLQTVDMGSTIQQDVVSVLDPASPAQLFRPSLMQFATKGAMMGLVVGVGILALLRGFDDRITSLVRLNEQLPLEIAGIVPVFEGGPDWLKTDDDRAPLREAFRNLRSWLQFRSQDETAARCILITSAVPDEGKSTIAANLACALSWSDQRVLLVDADFRCGGLHEQPGRRPDPGLAEVLIGKKDIKAATQCLTRNRLYLLSRGKAFRNGIDAVKQEKLKSVLETLRRQYDWIIIDASPLLAADDTCNIAPLVDGSLLVVRSRFSSMRLTKRALHLLESRHAKVLGSVYNACADTMDFPYYRYPDYHDLAAAV